MSGKFSNWNGFYRRAFSSSRKTLSRTIWFWRATPEVELSLRILEACPFRHVYLALKGVVANRPRPASQSAANQTCGQHEQVQS